MAYSSTIAVQVRAGATNESQELLLPNFGVSSGAVFYSNYALTALQEQNLLGATAIPVQGLALKYFFIKADSPVEFSVGTDPTPVFSGVTGLFFLEVYPTTGMLIKHLYVKAGNTGSANVSVLFAFGD